MIMGQLSFKGPGFEYSKKHGGEAANGKRKTARPIDPNRPLHLVIKSEIAGGPLSFSKKKNSTIIRSLLTKYSRKFGVIVSELSINSNHCHLILRVPTRDAYRKFIRALTGQIQQQVTKANKIKSLVGTFFSSSPFTRILEWGRDLRNAIQYVIRNEAEAHGLISYKPRGTKTKATRAGPNPKQRASKKRCAIETTSKRVIS
jgi:REP element-mobilizing transposase RayT